MTAMKMKLGILCGFLFLSCAFINGEEIAVGTNTGFIFSHSDGRTGDDKAHGLQLHYTGKSKNPHAGTISFKKNRETWVGVIFTKQGEMVRLGNDAQFIVAFDKPLNGKWTFKVQDYTYNPGSSEENYNNGNPVGMWADLAPGKKVYRINLKSLRCDKGDPYHAINQILLSPDWNATEGNCELHSITIVTDGPAKPENNLSSQSIKLAEKGFTFTGYHGYAYDRGNAYGIRSILDKYAGRHIQINFLVTFYVDESGNVTNDPRRTPSAASINHFLALIQNDFPEYSTGVYFYLDPSDSSWRAHIKNIDFDSWKKAINRYSLDISPDLILLSSEMLGIEGDENSEKWTGLINNLRRKFNKSKIGYCTDRNSNLLSEDTDMLPRWLYHLDFFGSTIWHSGTTLQDLKVKIMRTIASAKRVCLKLNTIPIFGEIGYPSASNALNSPWEISNTIDEELQSELFQSALPLFKGLPTYLWRIEPGADFRENGYSWLRKPAERYINTFLQ